MKKTQLFYSLSIIISSLFSFEGYSSSRETKFFDQVTCELSVRYEGDRIFRERSSVNMKTPDDRANFVTKIGDFTLKAQFENMHPAPNNFQFLDLRVDIVGPEVRTFTSVSATSHTANLSLIHDGQQYFGLCWLSTK